jgi:hypothetical protein
MNESSVGFSAFDVADMARTVSGLLTSTPGTSITVYQATTGRSYDPASGTASAAETPTTVTGWASDLRLDEIERIQGAQVGDRKILIRFADLATAPTTADRIQIGGVDHRVYSVIRGPLDTHFVLYASRVQ